MKIDYRTHVEELAQQIKATIYECRVCPPDHAHADRLTRECHVPPIANEAAYAIALHELGHLANDPIPPTHPALVSTSIGGLITELDRVFRMLMESKAPEHIIQTEIEAWQWAKDHALDWSPTMDHIRAVCMASYLPRFATSIRRGCR